MTNMTTRWSTVYRESDKPYPLDGAPCRERAPVLLLFPVRRGVTTETWLSPELDTSRPPSLPVHCLFVNLIIYRTQLLLLFYERTCVPVNIDISSNDKLLIKVKCGPSLSILLSLSYLYAIKTQQNAINAPSRGNFVLKPLIFDVEYLVINVDCK